MASRKIEKQIWRELKRISDNVPAELLVNLTKKTTIAPTTKVLIEKAIALPDGKMGMTAAKRKRFQNMLDAGVLDREVEVLDLDAEKVLSDWYEAEIAFAVKMGRLPKDAPLPSFIKKKGLKYAKKQHDRLKELFSAEEDSEVSASGDDPKDAGAGSTQRPDDRVLPPSGGGSDDEGSRRQARYAG